MSSDLTEAIFVVGGVLLFITTLILACLISSYESNEQKLFCYKTLEQKTALELQAVCGRLAS